MHPQELECHLSSGTKQYLAPEVFTKTRAHGPASDYWSLGILLFEMVRALCTPTVYFYPGTVTT